RLYDSTHHLLLVILVIASSSFTTVSTSKDLNPSTYTERAKLRDAVKLNGGSNRLLRTRKMDSEEPLVSLSALGIWKSNLLEKNFEEITDWVWAENIDEFFRMKSKGITRESMREALEIDKNKKKRR
ncbi:hypothetical protein JG687_00014739, partial [Phytophthora cactorum]